MTQAEFDKKYEREGRKWSDTFKFMAFCFSDTGERFRAVSIDGEPWIIMCNIWERLGLSKVLKNTAGHALDWLDNDEKLLVRLTKVAGIKPYEDSIHAASKYWAITIPGMVKIIRLVQGGGLEGGIKRNANEEKAYQFCTWVLAELIPEIEKWAGKSVQSKISGMEEDRVPKPDPVIRNKYPLKFKKVEERVVENLDKVTLDEMVREPKGSADLCDPSHVVKVIEAVERDVEKKKIEVEEAAYNEDEWTACILLDTQVRFYKYGLMGVVPPEWKEYELKLDPEYTLYMRLKEKFEPKSNEGTEKDAIKEGV